MTLCGSRKLSLINSNGTACGKDGVPLPREGERCFIFSAITATITKTTLNSMREVTTAEGIATALPDAHAAAIGIGD